MSTVVEPELSGERSLPELPKSAASYGVCLTFRCARHCAYCVHRFHDQAAPYRELSGAEWLAFFDRIESGGKPVILTGAEPGLHPDFPLLVAKLHQRHQVWVDTNLEFDLLSFVQTVAPSLAWENGMGGLLIRAQCHPQSAPDVVDKAVYLQKHGFQIQLMGFSSAQNHLQMERDVARCRSLGLDFNIMPFEAWYQERFYGGIDAAPFENLSFQRLRGQGHKRVLFAPDGSIYENHFWLYEQHIPMPRTQGGHLSAKATRLAESPRFDHQSKAALLCAC